MCCTWGLNFCCALSCIVCCYDFDRVTRLSKYCALCEQICFQSVELLFSVSTCKSHMLMLFRRTHISVFQSRLWVCRIKNIRTVKCVRHLTLRVVTADGNVFQNFLNSSVVLGCIRVADKSLARPGRKQATATEEFEYKLSYL
jgi:hypothetical protein